MDPRYFHDILLSKTRFPSILGELSPRQLDSLGLERTITLDGLVKFLRGKTQLSSVSLLVSEVKGSSLSGVSENTLFSILLEAVFGETELDPFAGNKPLLKPGVGNKNKITALRHGKYYLCFLTGYSIEEGNKTAWEALRARFSQRSMDCLEQLLHKLELLLWLPSLTDDVADSVHGLFAHIHPESEPPASPCDTALVLRQLTMLMVEALLGRDLFSPQCRQWVASGTVSQLPQKDRYTNELWDSLAKHFGSGVFALKRSEIRENLIPDIKLRDANRERTFQLAHKPDGSTRSPMEEILAAHPEQKLFLLCGQMDSGISGAGKTTSLRKLYYDLESQAPIFVPLSMVYSAKGLRELQREDSRPRLLVWLSRQGLHVEQLSQLAHRLILLDGLDELTDPQGIQSLCDELYELTQNAQQRIIVSSKLSPEKLGSWEHLSCISNVWARFEHCYIQPLRTAQKTACLPDIPLPLQAILTTPFLLMIYKDVQAFLRLDNTENADGAGGTLDLLSRWLPNARQLPQPGHAATVFYRYLAVQVCRWFDSNRANDAQNEADAFFLTHALPAVAFQMELNRIYDGRLVPDIHPVDSERIDRILDQSLPAFQAALPHYHAYQCSRQSLLSGISRMNKAGFYQGQAAAVLHREFDWDTFQYRHRFVNHSLQENLAALHLANLFFSAYHNGLSARQDLREFYICTLCFLPSSVLEKEAYFLDELFGPQLALSQYLSDGPQSDPTRRAPLNQYLLCALASRLCAVKGLSGKAQWQAAADQAYHALLSEHSNFAAQYRTDHILDLCGLAQSMRSTHPASAAAKARDAVAFTQSSQLINTDGYHALAKVYLEQIQYILNQDQSDALALEQRLISIPEIELAFSETVHQELVQLSGRTSETVPSIFGAVPAENLQLAHALLPILDRAKLRLQHYRQQQFFHNKTLEFLLTASYVAKSHSIYAAISQGTSGAALNMLACFLENQQEELENCADLPFFRRNPHLHIQMGPELEYPDHHRLAFLTYRRIYQIRRGPQPYSARKLAQAVLNRRIRLDTSMQPYAGPGKDRALTQQELEFLQEATSRACENPGAGYAIARIQYLHERANSPFNTPEAEPYLDEASMLFQREWTLCGCQEALAASVRSAPVNLNMVFLAAEYTPGYLKSADPAAWGPRLNTFFRQQLEQQGQGPVLYTLGTRMRKEYLREAWRRLCRLEDHVDSLRIQPQKGADKRWYQVAEQLELI